MSQCEYCRQPLLEGVYLSNGRAIHDRCFDEIQDSDVKLLNRISKEKDKLSSLNSELERQKGIGFKLVSIFSKPEIDSLKIESSIPIVQSDISTLRYELEIFRERVSSIYDYFLTYPPDWESRRAIIIRRDGEHCSSCGGRKKPHLHHKNPLSRGGSNKTDNLVLLCESCHSRAHGGRDFSGSFNHQETAFSKRVANIRYAIATNKNVQFGYRKPSDKGHKQRKVSPTELTIVDHRSGPGSTLCLRGYCEMRKAERVFALKRMRALKVMSV